MPIEDITPNRALSEFEKEMRRRGKAAEAVASATAASSIESEQKTEAGGGFAVEYAAEVGRLFGCWRLEGVEE